MAGMDYQPTEQMHASSGAGSFSKMMNLSGAVVSVALIGGLAVWGYKLVARDVSGVPIVRALEGPQRVQPEDPGGELARHQGLSVNRVQSDGEAAPAADRLVLAPRPVGVIEEDPAGVSLRPQPRLEVAERAEVTPNTEAADTTLAEPESTVAAVLSEEIEPAQQVTPPTPVVTAPAPLDVDALVEQIAAEEAPLSDVKPVAASAPKTVAPTVAGVAVSPRPSARPERVASLEAPAATEAVVATKEIDAASIPVGTRLVQLGAFDTPEIAGKEWDRLNVKFAEYLEGKSRVVQEAKSGGRTFYRLRAMGFDDLSDARRFCSALLAENAACIPVVVR